MVFREKPKSWEEFFSPDRIRKRWERGKEESKRQSILISQKETPEELVRKIKEKLFFRCKDKEKKILELFFDDLKLLFQHWQERKDDEKRWEALELIQHIEDLIEVFEVSNRLNK